MNIRHARMIGIIGSIGLLGAILGFGGARAAGSEGLPQLAPTLATPPAAEPVDEDCEASLEQLQSRLSSAQEDVRDARALLDRMRGPLPEGAGETDADGEAD